MRIHGILITAILLGSNVLFAAGTNQPEDVVARVHDAEIYRKQLEPSEWLRKEYEKQFPNQKWDDLAAQHRSKALSYYLWKYLEDGFVKEHNIQVTDQELDEFVASEMAKLTEFRKATKASLEQLKEQLRQNGISQAKRKELEQKITELNQKLAARADDNAEGCRLAGRVLLQSWKIHQALYRTYGGKVTKGKLGDEPFTAYRLFYQEREKKGDFQILDRDIREKFWEYLTTMKDPEVPKDEIDFTTPWWGKSKP